MLSTRYQSNDNDATDSGHYNDGTDNNRANNDDNNEGFDDGSATTNAVVDTTSSGTARLHLAVQQMPR